MAGSRRPGGAGGSRDRGSLYRARLGGRRGGERRQQLAHWRAPLASGGCGAARGAGMAPPACARPRGSRHGPARPRTACRGAGGRSAAPRPAGPGAWVTLKRGLVFLFWPPISSPSDGFQRPGPGQEPWPLSPSGPRLGHGAEGAHDLQRRRLLSVSPRRREGHCVPKHNVVSLIPIFVFNTVVRTFTASPQPALRKLTLG